MTTRIEHTDTVNEAVALYRREKAKSERRNARKSAGLRAAVEAMVARQAAAGEARKKGGRPRRSMPPINVRVSA